MTEQFQLGLLSYLVQSSNGESYIESVNDEAFDVIEFKLTAQLLKRYHHLRHRMPGELEASAFLEETIEATPEISDTVAKALREVFEDIYFPLEEKNRQFIEDQMIVNMQDSQIELLSSKYAKGEITPKEFLEKIQPISSLVIPGDDPIYKDSGFLAADRENHSDEQIEGNPTFLHDLNRLTAAGGFYTPQLIIFMSGPKHFKTGLLIRLALEYARDGYNVYYADGENGVRSIRNRAKMALMECELSDLYDGTVDPDEINGALYRFQKYMGGDMFIDSYPASTKSIQDVKNRLAFLKETRGFEPDLIVWDSLDHFKPSNKDDGKRDTRIKSQIVYHEAIALNAEIGTFAFGPSQVNRGGVSKKTLSMTDIAEDFGKVMNAHAVFAICATDDEMEQGIRRIIPVAQREGVGYRGKNQCIIKVDEATMGVMEAEAEEMEVEDD